jgi:hypothetical protein
MVARFLIIDVKAVLFITSLSRKALQSPEWIGWIIGLLVYWYMLEADRDTIFKGTHHIMCDY